MRLISVKIESNTRSHLLARAEPGRPEPPPLPLPIFRQNYFSSLSLSVGKYEYDVCINMLSSSAAADFDQDLKSYDIEKTNRTPDTGWHSLYNYWITCRIDPQNGVNANSNT